MANPRQEAAREKLREAIRAAGGTVSVAAKADIPQTHLSTVANGGRPMGRETAIKLRPVIELPAEEWVELLAPQDGTEAVA